MNQCEPVIATSGFTVFNPQPVILSCCLLVLGQGPCGLTAGRRKRGILKPRIKRPRKDKQIQVTLIVLSARALHRLSLGFASLASKAGVLWRVEVIQGSALLLPLALAIQLRAAGLPGQTNRRVARFANQCPKQIHRAVYAKLLHLSLDTSLCVVEHYIVLIRIAPGSLIGLNGWKFLCGVLLGKKAPAGKAVDGQRGTLS